MTESEVLDLIWEAFSSDCEFGLSFYEKREHMPRPEMYIALPNGDCWRISAEYHGNHD